jgi:hypothetical protein
MNASYYNAGPGERMVDEMFWECADIRDEAFERYLENLREQAATEPECGDDIDDAYDRECERDDYEGEEDFD